MLNVLKSLFTGAKDGHALTPREYTERFQAAKTPHQLIDVRTPEEFAEGHIPGAVNISLQSLSSRIDKIARDRAVILYCRSGNRSGMALTALRQAGYTEVYNLGGIGSWQAAGYEVKRK
jgi:rhodanese-related sulfurtransferase